MAVWEKFECEKILTRIIERVYNDYVSINWDIVLCTTILNEKGYYYEENKSMEMGLITWC